MDAFNEDGQWTEYTGQRLPLLGYNPPVEEGEDTPPTPMCVVPSTWPAEDKARFGVYPVVETPVPEGKRVASWSLVDDAGRPFKADVLEDIPVEPEAVPVEISRRQFYEGLVVVERITWAECLQVLRDGTLPIAVQAMLAEVPDMEIRNKAESRLIGAGSFFFSDQFVLIFAAVEGWSDDQVAAFWRLCSEQ